MRWVALLRAVNLGARNKVPMAQLRTLLEDAGYENVRTYIASGNVLLDGPAGRKALGSDLERLVLDAFGVTTAAILRKPQELAATVEAHPFDHASERPAPTSTQRARRRSFWYAVSPPTPWMAGRVRGMRL